MKIYTPATTRSKRTPPGSINWTGVMMEVLKENYLEMDNKELARAIGVTSGAVRLKLQQLHLVRPRKKPGPQAKPSTIEQQIRKKRKEQERRAINTTERLRAESRRRQEAKKMATRQQDLSSMRTLRIDHKTIVYIKPGQDPEKVRKQYQRTLSKDGYSKIEY